MTIISVEGIRRLSFDSDVLSLLPEDGRVIQSFKTFVARFGSLDQLYVVFTAPDGHAISEYSDEVDDWVEALRAAPEIERVDSGGIDRTRDLGWLADRQLLLLPRPSLDEALRRFTPEGTAPRWRPAANCWRSPRLTSPPSSGRIRSVSSTCCATALGGTQTGLSLGHEPGGFRHRGSPCPADHRAAAASTLRLGVLARARRQTERDCCESRQARHDRRAGELFDEALLPPMRVEFAGGHRIAVETESIVRRESIWNSVGSLALILPLLFLVFRSFWLVAVGSLPSALSLVLVLGGARVRRRAAVRRRDRRRRHAVRPRRRWRRPAVRRAPARPRASGRQPASAAIEGPSVSMLLGMFTTAATFYGLMFVDFPSLRQLGRLIGHSMVICGVLTLVMVPALLPRRPPRRPRPLAADAASGGLDRAPPQGHPVDRRRR